MYSYFSMTYLTTKQPKTQHFELHYHDGYEFLLFIEGDSNYIVEGNSYRLEPYDAIVIRRQEMHRILHNSNAIYTRFILNISPEFFKDANCEEYEKIFINNVFNGNNKISAKDIKSSGLYDIILSLIKYSDNGRNPDKPVVHAALVEFLYVLNEIKNFSKSEQQGNHIKDIISYINDHYTENISLDDLAARFFISKYHLCRLFKKSTGHTVHNYINHKRLTAARDLCKTGVSIGDACTLCGFADYSSFYRFYIKEVGESPKKSLK